MTFNGGVLPTSEDQNVVFFAVNGQNGFPSTIRLLRSMGIPWVVLADGPALRPGKRLAKYLRAEGLLESMPPAQRLEDVRKVWSAAGVYSFATEFGDDGTKSGEIDAFMESIDPTALAAARKTVGAQKGARVGAAFAAAVAPPPVVADLWAQMCNRLIGANN
ncbi:hypothetical protein [Kribbella sp. NPDC003557]|uniref:hypothetical protein n=1 Tax=Kribbella sp. NPDC003557 TaxID=3154449 RepID=UPI0033AAD5CE